MKEKLNDTFPLPCNHNKNNNFITFKVHNLKIYFNMD